MVYTLLGLFGYGICSFISDFTNFQYEREVDENLANLGPGTNCILCEETEN